MPAVITAVYPRPTKPDAEYQFDYGYYYKVHMPLLQATWASKGLQSWTVTEHTDKDEPYFLQCAMNWDSVAAFKQAYASADSAKVFEDVSNFTDVEPQILKGDVVRNWAIL